MIIDMIFDLGFGFINSIIETLHLDNFTFDTSVLGSFLDVLSSVAYFFPWAYIAPIFGFIVMLQAFRILISLMKLLSQLIPGY